MRNPSASLEPNGHQPDDTELAPDFTVRDYERARDSDPPERIAIANALYARFFERYIEPVQAKKRGFTIMAVSCLMIEAFESFVQGWESSDGRSEESFGLFFDQFAAFKDFRAHAADFYKHVRCGILHQAESTGGWRILRDNSSIFDSSSRTINAERFLDALQNVLGDFCQDLQHKPWNDPAWRNVCKKMDALVRNCTATPANSCVRPKT
jgi:hypothetical protein